MKFTIKMMTILFVFAASGLLQQDSFAQSGEACAVVQNDDSRLGCYDLVFRKTRISDSSAGKGKWKVTEDVSKFDDSRKVFLRLISEDKTRGKFGDNEYSHLVIACRENTTTLWMTFADQFMSSGAGDGSVTYRVDDRKAKSKPFVESNDNSALGLWNGGTSIPFLNELFGADELVVRATPFNESSVTATYDIRGLDEAIKPLKSACNW